MKYFLPAFFTLFSFSNISAQNVLKGKVTDISTGKALVGVSVYIINSTTGTSTDADGNFNLTGFTAKQFELVATCVGYETFTNTISANDQNNFRVIKLKQRSAVLENVIIQSYEKDGWNKWGQAFTDILIGQGEGAPYCTIKNKEVIRFIYDKDQKLLTAYAFEPIVIENKYLGYTLVYDMQEFVCDYTLNKISFMGSPFFKNMKGNDRKELKWQNNRQYVYEGSVMHFMRSLYRNALEREGFTINVLARYVNIEKQRIKKLYKEASKPVNGLYFPDSSDYYSKVLQQSDSLDYVRPNVLPVDSVAYAYDSTTAVLHFKGHLQISYAKEKKMYTQNHFNSSKHSVRPISIIHLIYQPQLYIFSDGSYYEPGNLMIEKYWGFTEKLSNLLPVTFNPL